MKAEYLSLFTNLHLLCSLRPVFTPMPYSAYAVARAIIYALQTPFSISRAFLIAATLVCCNICDLTCIVSLNELYLIDK